MKVGDTFGCWVVIDLVQISGKVLCKCSCGIETLVNIKNLRSGGSKRCKSCSSKLINTRHGCSTDGGGFYNVWRCMKARCLNPSNSNYKNYGGRGITVCEEWLSFEGFLVDMGPTYKEGLTLERINNDLGYDKSNCEWATREKQINNRRVSLKLKYKGGVYTEAQLSQLTETKRSTIQSRRNRGLTGEDLVK
jgi:hypothetical protein